MKEVFYIAGVSAAILGVALGGSFVLRRKSRLDGLYHEALRAESRGEYAEATDLYRAILDKGGNFLLLSDGARNNIKVRIETIRLEVNYQQQFGSKEKVKA
jgi:hypothetical protein